MSAGAARICFCGVVGITFACEAEGPRIVAGQKLDLWTPGFCCLFVYCLLLIVRLFVVFLPYSRLQREGSSEGRGKVCHCLPAARPACLLSVWPSGYWGVLSPWRERGREGREELFVVIFHQLVLFRQQGTECVGLVP